MWKSLHSTLSHFSWSGCVHFKWVIVQCRSQTVLMLDYPGNWSIVTWQEPASFLCNWLSCLSSDFCVYKPSTLPSLFFCLIKTTSQVHFLSCVLWPQWELICEPQKCKYPCRRKTRKLMISKLQLRNIALPWKNTTALRNSCHTIPTSQIQASFWPISNVELWKPHSQWLKNTMNESRPMLLVRLLELQHHPLQPRLIISHSLSPHLWPWLMDMWALYSVGSHPLRPTRVSTMLWPQPWAKHQPFQAPWLGKVLSYVPPQPAPVNCAMHQPPHFSHMAHQAPPPSSIPLSISPAHKPPTAKRSITVLWLGDIPVYTQAGTIFYHFSSVLI